MFGTITLVKKASFQRKQFNVWKISLHYVYIYKLLYVIKCITYGTNCVFIRYTLTYILNLRQYDLTISIT